MTDEQERQRRERNAAKILKMLRRNVNQWLPWKRFARYSSCAWRTRISDARKIIEGEGGSVQWNKNTQHSAYRYVP